MWGLQLKRAAYGKGGGETERGGGGEKREGTAKSFIGKITFCFSLLRLRPPCAPAAATTQ